MFGNYMEFSLNIFPWHFASEMKFYLVELMVDPSKWAVPSVAVPGT